MHLLLIIDKVDSSSRNQAEPEQLEQAVYCHVEFLTQAQLAVIMPRNGQEQQFNAGMWGRSEVAGGRNRFAVPWRHFLIVVYSQSVTSVCSRE